MSLSAQGDLPQCLREICESQSSKTPNLGDLDRSIRQQMGSMEARDVFVKVVGKMNELGLSISQLKVQTQKLAESAHQAPPLNL
jgi:hypothetical protein